ncbi:hypothetical protein MTO96_021292 [Rhipicephalus appendiculatus]
MPDSDGGRSGTVHSKTASGTVGAGSAPASPAGRRGAALSAARGGAPLSLTSVFIRECLSPSAAVRDSE